jgi:hypothetical protein
MRSTFQARRSFLRHASGAVLALPFFESLQSASQAASSRPALRFAVFYVPIGVVRKAFFPGEASNAPVDFGRGNQGWDEFRANIANRPAGRYPWTWTPTLQPLEKMSAKVTLITGLERRYQEGSDVHEQCGCCFLTSLANYEGPASRMPQGRTLDHILAEKLGADTPFRTLEFSCNSHQDNKESIHFDNISWYGPDYVAPSLRSPQAAYRRMFGGAGSHGLKPITDLVLADAEELSRRLGYADQQKLQEYYDSLRTIEQQMNRLRRMQGELERLSMDEPSAAYLPRGEYIRLMGDLMIVALQSGLTRCTTMMIAPERWDSPFLFEEVSDKPLSHHKMSHNASQYARELEKVDEFHMRQFAYLVERMDSIVEADGRTLLDNTLFTFGSGLGDGATHQYDHLPIVVAGGAGGQVKTGLHVHCQPATPLANLWLTQAKVLGRPLERFADSLGLVEDWLV